MCALRTVGQAGMHVYMVYLHLLGIYTLLVCGVGDFFQYRSNVRRCKCNFSSQFFVHINVELYIHAFMHPCLVQLRFSCDGEKTGKWNIFLKCLWYVNMGEDYTTQSRIGFDWHYPHLFKYFRYLHEKTRYFACSVFPSLLLHAREY